MFLAWRKAAFSFVLAVSCCSAASVQTPDVSDLSSRPVNPFVKNGKVQVFVFARTDCPITKRYAPELRRLSHEFGNQPIQFWIVFADRTETPTDVRFMVEQYGFPGTPILDPKHEVVRIARATTAPEAVVFDRDGRTIYRGRIDDLYVDVGKSRAAAQIHDLEDAISAALMGKPVKQPETRAVGCSLADIE